MGFSLLELHTCVLSHFSSSHAFHWVRVSVHTMPGAHQEEP